jgi:hypothetical protein
MPLFGGRLLLMFSVAISIQDKTRPEDTKQEIAATKQKNSIATIPKAYKLGKTKETKQYQTKSNYHNC